MPLVIAPTLATRGSDLREWDPPEPQREFRGAWIASVANTDWPSEPGLSRREQQNELIAMMDRAVHLRLNAIILQVRPACDALYPSSLEPWSEYLTGEMGEAPSPTYDPLRFAIAEAHRRGLELHAWFNPFRARHPATESDPARTHISQTHPELVRQYGPYLWLDPGSPAVQRHTRNVILDVLRRYDVDGIHLDDYFYPYKIRNQNGKLIDFPDDTTWERYRRDGGTLGRADWRRDNVNDFVRDLYGAIKKRKPWVKFGISPFGIWRPGHPPQIKGLDAYSQLYADAQKWLRQGWLDYCAPQLYWAIEPKAQSYPALQAWWAEQNVKRRHLWPGNRATKVGSGWQPDEIVQQIRLTRRQRNASGNIFWNLSALLESPKLSKALAGEVYHKPALIPASPWLSQRKPPKPKLSLTPNRSQGLFDVQWRADDEAPVWLWVFQSHRGHRWTTEILPRNRRHKVYPASDPTALPSAFAVSAINRYGNRSKPTILSTTQVIAKR